jgi:hypothetical protein
VITGLRQAGLPIGAVFYFWPPGQFNRKANFRDRRLRGRTFQTRRLTKALQQSVS